MLLHNEKGLFQEVIISTAIDLKLPVPYCGKKLLCHNDIEKAL
jgi:hypothetical protein